MPRQPTSNLPHTAQTDHRLRKSPAADRPHPFRAIASRLWDEGEPRLETAVVERARHILTATGELASSDEAGLFFITKRLQQRLTAEPHDGIAWEALARAALKTNQPQLARSAAEQAAKQLADNDSTLRVQAAAAIAANAWSEADAALQQALELVPDDAESWELLAHLRMREGRLTEAIEAANKAKSLDPARPMPHAYLADALLQLQQPAEAREHYERFRRLQATPR
jgi:tetratricopeptide (TPR) repeat protein